MTVGAWLPQLVLLDRLQLFKQNLPFIAFALAWLGHVFSAVFALVQRYSFVVESSTIPPILLADVVAALLYAEAVIGSPLLIEALADATDPGVSLDYHDEEKVDV